MPGRQPQQRAAPRNMNTTQHNKPYTQHNTRQGLVPQSSTTQSTPCNREHRNRSPSTSHTMQSRALQQTAVQHVHDTTQQTIHPGRHNTRHNLATQSSTAQSTPIENIATDRWSRWGRPCGQCSAAQSRSFPTKPRRWLPQSLTTTCYHNHCTTTIIDYHMLPQSLTTACCHEFTRKMRTGGRGEKGEGGRGGE